MKRFGMLAFSFFLCGLMAGCATETHEGLVIDTIKRIDIAAAEVGNITASVKQATDAAKTKGGKLDLTDAGKAAEKLKETGIKIVEIKQRIDMVRNSITDEEKRAYSESQKNDLNKVFGRLVQQQTDLREALAAAEVYDKAKVDDLRKKIVDAESPFEAQARQ